MRRLLVVIGVLLTSTVTLTAQRQAETRIIVQDASPVAITNYTAYPDYRGARGLSASGIAHLVDYQNISDKRIVAVQVGLVAFDIWNEFLEWTGGIKLDILVPGGKVQTQWTATAYGRGYSFHTGVAYVSRVRFEDGQIWKADLGPILAELRKIESSFSPENLENKEKRSQ